MVGDSKFIIVMQVCVCVPVLWICVRDFSLKYMQWPFSVIIYGQTVVAMETTKFPDFWGQGDAAAAAVIRVVLLMIKSKTLRDFFYFSVQVRAICSFPVSLKNTHRNQAEGILMFIIIILLF